MSDPIAAFLLVALEGFIQGWFALSFALHVSVRLRRKRITWNTALAILLIMTVGLSAVIYAVLTQAPRLTGPFAYLPAALIGASFAGGLAYLGRVLYAAGRAVHRERR